MLELAELVEHNHPKVSRSLATLEQMGLVSRGEADHDHRVKTAAVTAEGRRIVAAINNGRRRLLAEAFAGWSERDRASFARLSRRFADAMVDLVGSPGAASRGPDEASRRG